MKDVYVHADVPDSLELRALAARLVLPSGGVLSGTSAAWLHGADIRQFGDDDLEVTLLRNTPMSPRSGLRVRRAELLDEDVTHVGDLPTTTAIRTAFDLARRPALRQNLTEHVVATDALSHLGYFRPEQLAAYAARERFAGWRGVRQVAAVVAHTEPLTESPGETRVRMRIALAGLPRPEAQVSILNEGGGFVARVDLAYPERSLAIEYDGECHEGHRKHDARRRNHIRELGWQVYVYTSKEVRPGDPTIVRQLRKALAIPLTTPGRS